MKKFNVLIVLVLVAVFAPKALPAIVVVDDHFDDGVVGTNTSGIGTGFNTYVSTTDGSATITESGSVVSLIVNISGGCRTSITSKEGGAIGTGITRFAFLGVSFAPNPANTGTGTTDRLYLGIRGNGNTAYDMQANPDMGFWIQIESDSVPTASGSSGWTGTSSLFYESSVNARTVLASWTFDTLDIAGNSNYSPVFDFVLDIGADGYALSIDGDTISNLTGSLSDTYANAGITNELTVGYAALFQQMEAPSVTTSVDQIVITESIPEPATMLLLGLGSLVSLRRRK